MLAIPSLVHADWTATSGMPGDDYAGTFSACGKYVLYGARDDGIYRSTDEGATWVLSNTGMKNTGLRNVIAASPVSLVSTLTDSLWRSLDTGATWMPAGALPAYWYANGFAACGNSLFAVTSTPGEFSQGAVYRSLDGGISWASVYSRLSYPWALGSMGNTVIATFDGGIARSPDQGKTWSVSGPLATGANPYLNGIVTDGNQVFAKGNKGGLWRSADTGATWKPLPEAPFDSSFFTMAATGNTLLVLGNSQAFASSDYGTSWVRFETGLPVGTFLRGAGAAGNYLFIVTGKGIWRRPVSEVPAGIADSPAARTVPGFVKTGQPGKVAYYLPERGLVHLDLLDSRGIPVAKGFHAALPSGLHEYTLAVDLPPGVYWVRLSVSGVLAYSRITLVSR